MLLKPLVLSTDFCVIALLNTDSNKTKDIGLGNKHALCLLFCDCVGVNLVQVHEDVRGKAMMELLVVFKGPGNELSGDEVVTKEAASLWESRLPRIKGDEVISVVVHGVWHPVVKVIFPLFATLNRQE